MSEKRFTLHLPKKEKGMGYIVDNSERMTYFLGGENARKNITNLLNELVKDNEELGISIKLFEDDVATKDKKIDEQQATIKKLQDLCGKSDYENAKLRKEIKLLKPVNIEQYEQIVQLQEENEQLRQELQGMEELLQSYRKTIKHDAELLADASKNGYLPPLNDYIK